jgi:hypothetical protein
MSRDQAFFIYPHVEKPDAARAEIERLAKLGAGFPPGIREAFEELLLSVEGKRQFAHMAPHLESLEFVLLCMLAEVAQRMRVLEDRRWVHPPFP